MSQLQSTLATFGITTLWAVENDGELRCLLLDDFPL